MAGDAVRKVEPEAAAAPPVQKAAPVKEIAIDLAMPVQAHGETMKRITFRRPTGGDIMAMGEGYPVIVNWSTGVVTPNPAIMGNMMSVLAAVPPSTIKSLDANDWSTCAHALMGFFTPGEQAMRY